jgi:predicted MFS family arabinose efflux permease
MRRPQSERRARLAVAAIFLANGAIVGTWAAHIPLVAGRHAIGHATLGVALLAMALGALLAMPLSGAAIARFGSARVTRIATLACLAAFALPLTAPDVILLMAGLFVFGAANGAMDVAMNAHGVAVERRLDRAVMSSFHGMWSLGGLSGAGLAALLLPILPPVAEAALATALAATLAGAALFFLLPSAADGGASGAAAFALPSRPTFVLGLLCFLCMSSEGAILDWGALHLKTHFAASAAAAATGFAAFSAAMAASRFLGDRLRTRFGAAALVRGSAVVAAVGLAAALAAPAVWLAIPGFAIVGLGLANLVPVFFGAAGRIPGRAAGTSLAAVATMGYSGFLVGPPLIGFVADATSLAAALAMVGIACLVIALAAAATEPDHRPAAA